MKKPFKPNAADFLFHKFSVAKQPKERSLSKVESEIRMRILGLLRVNHDDPTHRKVS